MPFAAAIISLKRVSLSGVAALNDAKVAVLVSDMERCLAMTGFPDCLSRVVDAVNIIIMRILLI